GAGLVEVVPAGLLRVGERDDDESQRTLALQHVVDELDRALLADRERRDRLREDDGLLQRQHRERRGDLDVAGLERLFEVQVGHARPRIPIVTRSVCGALAAIGRVIVSIPCSYRAVAAVGSTGSSSGMRRWNGPYSISSWRYRPVTFGRQRSPATTSTRSAAITLIEAGSTPGSSTITRSSGGSAQRMQSACGRNPRRAPAKRGRCQRSSTSSLISSCSRSMSVRFFISQVKG